MMRPLDLSAHATILALAGLTAVSVLGALGHISAADLTPAITTVLTSSVSVHALSGTQRANDINDAINKNGGTK
jgi:hypothetical protein